MYLWVYNQYMEHIYYNKDNKSDLRVSCLDYLTDNFNTDYEEACSIIDRYLQQGQNVANRGIPFLISFQEWWDFWMCQDDAGHVRWENRGKGAHNYVMCRYMDRGPYHKDNIYCATNNENLQHANRSWPPKFVYEGYRRNKGRWDECNDDIIDEGE